MEMLFGKRLAIAAIDLQGHLQELADRIPNERCITVNRLIDSLTLFPYVTAFEPPLLQVKVRHAMMRGAVENLHIRLGLVAFRIERIKRLRFCPECMLEMSASYGELYWRRDHQLPSALVCQKHGCTLLESAASFSQYSRHEFIAATPENCPCHSRPVAPVMDQLVLSHLHHLSSLSVDLLENPPEPRTFAGWTEFYRRQMVDAGLARSPGTMDQQSFDKEFRSFYGRTLELLPNVMEGREFSGNWLSAMVRKHRKANHPLYHLLVQNFLAQRDRYISPFGAGPWACLNPLVRHRSKAPIKDIEQHSNHGKTVGVFACDCGYTYTRCYDPAKIKLGPPRFLHYGPLLEPALRRLVAEGVSLRKTGRMLQLEPKTVIRLAGEMRIAVPWQLRLPTIGKIISKGSVANKSAVEVFSCKQSVSGGSRKELGIKRCDWDEIDGVWLAKLTVLSTIIRKESPPVRITVAEMERRSGQRNWLLKRRNRLPQTMAFLERAVESIKDFQVRRIRWAISELEQQGGPVKAWQVMRKAGLRSVFLELINAELELKPDFWSAAA